ncbi:MAG: hypothetical protein NUW37_08435 [Planctomycetes bacterium]|nr:hypothetical protein [Planctomycetota bacterium]
MRINAPRNNFLLFLWIIPMLVMTGVLLIANGIAWTFGFTPAGVWIDLSEYSQAAFAALGFLVVTSGITFAYGMRCYRREWDAYYAHVDAVDDFAERHEIAKKDLKRTVNAEIKKGIKTEVAGELQILLAQMKRGTEKMIENAARWLQGTYRAQLEERFQTSAKVLRYFDGQIQFLRHQLGVVETQNSEEIANGAHSIGEISAELEYFRKQLANEVSEFREEKKNTAIYLEVLAGRLQDEMNSLKGAVVPAEVSSGDAQLRLEELADGLREELGSLLNSRFTSVAELERKLEQLRPDIDLTIVGKVESVASKFASEMQRIEELTQSLEQRVQKAETNKVSKRLAPVAESATQTLENEKKIFMLEKRLGKFSRTLEKIEGKLTEYVSIVEGELGIASVYKEVQGLDRGDNNFSKKTHALKHIFELNLAIQKPTTSTSFAKAA